MYDSLWSKNNIMTIILYIYNALYDREWEKAQVLMFSSGGGYFRIHYKHK
jgi:hypothetical protein